MIDKSTWTQIETLSELDTKSISECVLKVFEEGGELAGKVQPFAGLDGAHHRIATKRDILEECVDGTLANLSIACKLGFSMEETADMMQQKMKKWARLQKSQAIMHNKIPFEIHITVSEANSKQFIDTCKLLDVKPIILALQAGEDVIRDVMTSSTCMGSNVDAIKEMERISSGLIDAGFDVVRKKIETVPWHPAAPSLEHNQPDMPKHCYFESHIAVLIDSKETSDKVAEFCKAHSLHMSRNAMKKYDDDSYKLMLTYRAYSGNREEFIKTLERYVSALGLIKYASGDELNIDKVITEFSLFDSKVHHDAEWLAIN